MTRSVLACALAAATVDAAAQAYPSRAIRVVIPYPPGGGSDMLIRPIAARVSELVGQPLIMDNRPGGGSTIGTQIAAKSPPDGYTALIVDLAYYANPALEAALARNIWAAASHPFAPALARYFSGVAARQASAPISAMFSAEGWPSA